MGTIIAKDQKIITTPVKYGETFYGSHIKALEIIYIQYNLDDSNTDGSFTLDDWNSFLSPYKILLIGQENKYSKHCLIYYEIVRSNEYIQHTIIL